MIEIEKEISGNTEVIKIAENWDEVYYSTYVNLMKDKILLIEEDYERTLKVMACVSSDREKCELWLKEMANEQFQELVKLMEFKRFDELELTEKEIITIGDKTYKIKTDLDSIKWGSQTSFELLKDQFKDTEDYVLALGVILSELDKDGNELPFDLKRFDYVVNNLPEKLLMVDIFQHVNFFLTGVKKQYLKTLPKFTIKKVK
jgi:hypothetical protein